MRTPLLTLALATSTLVAPSHAHAASLTLVAEGFQQPLFVTGLNNMLYVVEQGGKIIAVDRTTKAKTTFFTVPNLEVGGEKGLLGFAFDPVYARNGRFYVNCTTRVNGQLVSEIRRYTDPAKAIEAPLLILRVNQPFDNHNGGWIGFGGDRDLYVAFGDGGSGNDPQNNAQNKNVLLGKMLRIDIRKDGFPGDPDRNYTIPADNPFGNEVYAYGLRNPFRNSFDVKTGNLWIGDVGQGAYEEIDLIPRGSAGLNFGWRPLEGPIATPGIGEPAPANAVTPVLSYPHGDFGASIIGGYVYRGRDSRELFGRYVFGDFISGKIFARKADGSGFDTVLTPAGVNISSFGIDSERNLYVVNYNGSILRIGA